MENREYFKAIPGIVTTLAILGSVFGANIR